MQVHSITPHTRVGLISDEPLRIAGLESAFEGHPSITTIAGSLDSLLSDSHLRFVILDVRSNQSWMEMQLTVRRIRPDMQQIVLGPAGSDELILRSISGGARAYLDSNSGPLAVRQAVESVIHGTIWAPRRVLSALIDRLLSSHGKGAPAPAQVLSPRERQVLDLIMVARSNREIAAQLGIEERTVKAYVANLLRKTGAENRVTLSVVATRESLRDQRVLPS